MLYGRLPTIRTGPAVSPLQLKVRASDFDQGQLFRGKPCSQAASKVAIDLDCADLADALNQRARERGLTRSDFDDGLPTARIDRLDNLCDDAGVMQEILAEPLTCSMRLRRTHQAACC